MVFVIAPVPDWYFMKKASCVTLLLENRQATQGRLPWINLTAGDTATQANSNEP